MALSIGAGYGLGVVGAALSLDIRNLGHTVSHHEMSYDWGKRLVINGVAVLPVVGVIKYLKYFDDAGDLANRADDLSAGGRRLSGQWDAGNYPTPPGRSAAWTLAPGSSEGARRRAPARLVQLAVGVTALGQCAFILASTAESVADFRFGWMAQKENPHRIRCLEGVLKPSAVLAFFRLAQAIRAGRRLSERAAALPAPHVNSRPVQTRRR
ncbi:MAG: hypothetical protein EXS06_02570 [Planctomycetaceae bacterium]|nr:hypothetical protein [Planctomycetaceae bacterium]